METKTSGNTITITGNIKSVSDYEMIKNQCEGLKDVNNILPQENETTFIRSLVSNTIK